jgi:group I intron endonuclease
MQQTVLYVQRTLGYYDNNKSNERILMSKKLETSHAGIYLITNKITGTTYVGQAINITIRWASHRRTLRRNMNHRNSKLQRAWNKYGEENFEFKVYLKLVEKDRFKLDLLLDEEEIKALKNFKNNCYNLMEAGISAPVASEETIRKLSLHNKKQWQNPQHRAKISKAQKAAWAEPGRKEERAAQLRESFKDPEYQKRRKELSKQMWAEGGSLRSTQMERLSNQWKDPAYIAKQKESRKKTWLDPEVRAKRSKAIKEAWARRKALKLLQS